MADTEGTRTETEEEKKARQTALILKGIIWRCANWAVILWIANSAFWWATGKTQLPYMGRYRFIFLMVTICEAATMVILAKRLEHDKLRLNAGKTTAAISTAVVMIPLLYDLVVLIFGGLVNVVSSIFGNGNAFSMGNYSIHRGVLWVVNLILTVTVWISLLKEDEFTDKQLGFWRTPQKRHRIKGTVLGRETDMEEWDG